MSACILVGICEFECHVHRLAHVHACFVATLTLVCVFACLCCTNACPCCMHAWLCKCVHGYVKACIPCTAVLQACVSVCMCGSMYLHACMCVPGVHSRTACVLVLHAHRCVQITLNRLCICSIEQAGPCTRDRNMIPYCDSQAGVCIGTLEEAGGNDQGSDTPGAGQGG